MAGKVSKKKAQRQEYELGRQLITTKSEIRRFIWWGILLVYGFIAFYALGSVIHTEFEIQGYPVTIWMIVQFLLVVLISLLTNFEALPAFSWLVTVTLPALLISVPVIFAPEIRRALERLGRAGAWLPRDRTKASKF